MDSDRGAYQVAVGGLIVLSLNAIVADSFFNISD
jgi:hypothetical protein